MPSAAELQSVQVSLNQVTMDALPQENNLTMIRTQYSRAAILSSRTPRPASSLPPPSPPSHTHLGPQIQAEI